MAFWNVLTNHFGDLLTFFPPFLSCLRQRRVFFGWRSDESRSRGPLKKWREISFRRRQPGNQPLPCAVRCTESKLLTIFYKRKKTRPPSRSSKRKEEAEDPDFFCLAIILHHEQRSGVSQTISFRQRWTRSVFHEYGCIIPLVFYSSGF